MSKKTTNRVEPTLILKLRAWLGYDGCALFTMFKEETGTVSPVLDAGGFPHPVHFHEGMSVRNFMRGCPECKGWTDIELDDTWTRAVELAIYA